MLLNHAGWSLASHPCGIPSRHCSLLVNIIDTILHDDTHIFDNVTVVRDEEKRSAFRQVDLHSDQTTGVFVSQFVPSFHVATRHSLGVSRQMMQRDALAEIKRPLVKRLPVPERQ